MPRHNLLGSVRRTIQDFDMIQEEDRIVVGLSGGKDSMALLHALARYRRFSPVSFELRAVTVDPGLSEVGYEPLERFCAELDVPYRILYGDIAEVVFRIREESNPCSLCANMRRGMLVSEMNRLGDNKLALGHHLDDAIATYFMNLLYTGRLKTIEPAAFLSRRQVTVIRPMIETAESSVRAYIDEHGIPVLRSACPMDKKTNREHVAQFVRRAYAEHSPAARAVPTAIRTLLRSALRTDGSRPGPTMENDET